MRIRSLHSRDASKRYRASIAFAKKYPDVKELWPRGCFGAANGWLLLVGPSPGKAGPKELSSLGGDNRPINKLVMIGPNVGTINFKSGRNRNKRWNYLAFSVFGNEEHAAALTAVANLDWGHFPDQNDIEASHLQEGCPVVFGVMKMSQPRIVLALSKKVWDSLGKYLRFCTLDDFRYRNLEGRIIQIPNCRFKSFFLRSPNHPSRFLSNNDCSTIASAIKQFLHRY